MTAVLADNLPIIAASPNGVKKIRELILRLAFMGRLVPQNPEDEPARELLKRMKSQYSSSGKNARTDFEEISGDQRKKLLPKGWELCRFGQVAVVKSELVSPAHYPNYHQVAPDSIEKGTGRLVERRTVAESGVVSPNHRFYPGQILYSKIRPSLSKAVLVDFEGLCSADMYPLETELLPEFFLLQILSPSFLQQVKLAENRVKMPKLNRDSLLSFVVSVPPFSEQERIVQKVHELMALCNRLESQQSKSEDTHILLVGAVLDTLLQASDRANFASRWNLIEGNFDVLFTTESSIDLLKDCILNLAVRGKLVPQNPKDESATEYLRRIESRKHSGKEKIDSNRKTPHSGTRMFDIPTGWEWASYMQIGELSRGKSKHRPRNEPSLFEHGTYPLVQTGDIARAKGEVTTYSSLYNEKGLAQSRLWPKGTLCITIAANIADTAILGLDACFPDSVVGFIPFDKELDVRFFDMFMKTAKSYLEDFAPSTAQKNINVGILQSLLIPLPPFAELKRIVTKVNELMKLCDQLKNLLSAQRSQQQCVASSMIEEALMNTEAEPNNLEDDLVAIK